MEEDKCKTCIWACKRDFDTSMVLCQYRNNVVWAESLPCKMYERYGESWYSYPTEKSAVQ